MLVDARGKIWRSCSGRLAYTESHRVLVLLDVQHKEPDDWTHLVPGLRAWMVMLQTLNLESGVRVPISPLLVRVTISNFGRSNAPCIIRRSVEGTGRSGPPCGTGT